MGLSFGSKHDYGEKEYSNRKVRDRDGDDGTRGKMETISNHPRNRAEYASHLTQNKREMVAALSSENRVIALLITNFFFQVQIPS